MKVLIVGSGGREHALAWRAARAPETERVYVAPGNGGTALEHGMENIEIAADDIDGLLEFARAESIGLTIVGPEVPLVAGIVDKFQEAGQMCFGPTAGAAQLEGSKEFSKQFMVRHGIPTAAYASFSDVDEALEYVRSQGAPIVIKADGLAAGKGVVVARTLEEAEGAVRHMLADQGFGEAGSRVVIEEFLDGEEASFIVVCDGNHAVPLVSSQDHKARDDGDQGPNTGGMGAYSPAPVVTPDVTARIMSQVIEPTLAGMRADGHPFTGFLYAGLMIADDGDLKVLEFNVRCGDPETQPIMLRLRSSLPELCLAACRGELKGYSPKWDPRAALGVVMAAGGYPGPVKKGHPIMGLDAISEAHVFHAGTELDAHRIVTAGGRVLTVCALGDTIAAARDSAYRAVEQIHWHRSYFRRDIGHRAIAKS